MSDQSQPASPVTNAPKNHFEKTLEALQSTVRQLESGELSLEDALQAFEQGVALARSAQTQLSAAEQRVEQLVSMSADGQAEVRPFVAPANPNDQAGGPRS